jgi:stage V sporulation protein K
MHNTPCNYAKDFLGGKQREIFYSMFRDRDEILIETDAAVDFWNYASNFASAFGKLGVICLDSTPGLDSETSSHIQSFTCDVVQMLGIYETDRVFGDDSKNKQLLSQWRLELGITHGGSYSDEKFKESFGCIFREDPRHFANSDTTEHLLGFAIYLTEILGRHGYQDKRSKILSLINETMKDIDNKEGTRRQSNLFSSILGKALAGAGIIASAAAVSTVLAGGVAAVGVGRVAIDAYRKNNDDKQESLSNDLSLQEQIQEIDNMIGLEKIKSEVRSLVNVLKIRALRKSEGLPNVDISSHMVFFGNPGTGKTTIARKLGDIYRELGLLSKGHFIEVDRSDLVGQVVGETAAKTRKVLDSALGGILFIDEAYTLASTFSEDYGHEAINTILTCMENNRDNIVIIAAGYENPMKDFVRSNPGLQSRFSKYFRFEDYSADELFNIFVSNATESCYILGNSAREHLQGVTRSMVRAKSKTFGNGRVIRNLFEDSLANQANRLAVTGSPSVNDLMKIAEEDISLDYALRLATGEVTA